MLCLVIMPLKAKAEREEVGESLMSLSEWVITVLREYKNKVDELLITNFYNKNI